MLLKIINEWLCNVQLFPKVWNLEISIKVFRISGSLSGSRLKAVLDIRIRLQTHYPSGYPTGKPDSDHLCWICKKIRVQQFFKFDNPTPIQIPATIIDPTVIHPWCYLRNDLTDSCYCRSWKVTPDPGPIFPKFLTPGPIEKHRILPESTPALRIRSHLWSRLASRDDHYPVFR